MPKNIGKIRVAGKYINKQINAMVSSKYPIKYKIVNLPNTPREYQIECFNLDEFRKNKTINNMNKVELE